MAVLRFVRPPVHSRTPFAHPRLIIRHAGRRPRLAAPGYAAADGRAGDYLNDLRSVLSEENNRAFGRDQSFVAGDATNVQLMVKDSTKHAATGGWSFAQFNDGKPVDEAGLGRCHACHRPVKGRDHVFTRYAP